MLFFYASLLATAEALDLCLIRLSHSLEHLEGFFEFGINVLLDSRVNCLELGG